MKTHLLNIIQEAELALEKLETTPDPEPDKPQISYEEIRDGILRVSWPEELSQLNGFDIWYYNKSQHRLWQLNIRMHVDDDRMQRSLDRGWHDIPMQMEGDWLIQGRAEDYESNKLKYTYKESAPTPAPPKDAKKIVVVENKRGDGNFYASVTAVIPVDDKFRIYFQNRGKGRTEYVETTDFENFSQPQSAQVETSMFMYDDRGTIRGYQGDGDTMYLYDNFHPSRGARDRERKAYDWRIDGQVNMGYIDGQYLSTGRVRGTRTPQTGGWADDWPAYPDKRDYPDIAEAFPDYYDANEFLRDRRGISLHTSSNRRNWNNRILADPVDYQQFEAFAGWTDKGADGIGDFYASTYLPGGKLMIKAYMKQKSRLIDRFDNPDHDDRDVRRRWRFTGETIIIPGVVEGNSLKIISTDSIIPREFHDRKTPSGVSWATDKNAVEWGQVSPCNTIIRRDGFVYIFYGYRDDIHYEALPDRFNNVSTGIYCCKMTESEFNSKFE